MDNLLDKESFFEDNTILVRLVNIAIYNWLHLLYLRNWTKILFFFILNLFCFLDLLFYPIWCVKGYLEFICRDVFRRAALQNELVSHIAGFEFKMNLAWCCNIHLFIFEVNGLSWVDVNWFIVLVHLMNQQPHVFYYEFLFLSVQVDVDLLWFVTWLKLKESKHIKFIFLQIRIHHLKLLPLEIPILHQIISKWLQLKLRLTRNPHSIRYFTDSLYPTCMC